MTHEEHRQRHIALHEALDELVADWFSQTSAVTGTPVWDLVLWSKQQTVNPTSNRFKSDEEAHVPIVQVDRLWG